MIPMGLLAAGSVALVLSALFGLSGEAPFFQAYLSAYTFWIQIALGSTAYLMMHVLTGGNWGPPVQRYLRAANRTYAVLALLFVPVLFGLGRLYEWTDAATVATDPKLHHKALYLNVPFFVIRSAIWLGSWWLVARLLSEWSEKAEAGDARALARLRKLSGGGLVWYGFSATFAYVDWVMSLEPHWYSTIYGMLVFAALGLTALTFALALLGLAPPDITLKTRRDLGNLLLANVMVWAYLSFMQYLVVWSGNLPEEVTWFNHRREHGWQWLITLIFAFQFAAPFLLLLFRPVKHDLRTLARVALVILLVRAVDHAWFVLPAFAERTTGPHPWSWIGIRLGTLAGIGAVWGGVFLLRLAGREVRHAS